MCVCVLHHAGIYVRQRMVCVYREVVCGACVCVRVCCVYTFVYSLPFVPHVTFDLALTHITQIQLQTHEHTHTHVASVLSW